VTAALSHPFGLPIPRARFTVSLLSARTGLRLSGQADLATAGLLQQAITALPPSADEIHLLLASLEFIDVAAARELVMLTVRPPRPRLVLHCPPPGLLKLLELCWPEARSRFTISTAPPGQHLGRGTPGPEPGARCAGGRAGAGVSEQAGARERT
jgi:hypothetical protein